MQIADYLGQYASTLANAPAAAPSANTGSTPVQNLVSAFTEMQEGAVFEGSVNAMDGSKILLGLSNGQTLSARLEGNISLTLGQSVFFQVKSNDGKTIAIKPFTGAQAFNPTIQKALEAAGMEMTKDTIDMVNSMMEEGMPIDRASLAMMRHTLMSNPQVSMQTAVLMNKLGIPVNSQMAAQFENYQNDQHAVLTQIQDVMDELPGVFAKASGTASDVLQLNQQLLSILDASGNPAQEQEAPQLFAPASGQEPAQEGAVLKPGQQPADSAQQTAAALKAALAGAQTLPEAGQEGLSAQYGDGAARMYLEVVGGVNIPDRFVGIPYRKSQSMTTYSQLLSMMEELEGVSYSLQYDGAFNGGWNGEMNKGAKLEGANGKRSELRDVLSYAESQGIPLYMQVAPSQVWQKGNGFRASRHAVRDYADDVVSLSRYQPVLGILNSALSDGMQHDSYSLLSPHYLGAVTDAFLDGAKEYGNLAVSDLAGMYYADYRYENYVSGETGNRVIEENLEKLSDGRQLALANPHMDKIGYGGVATDVSRESSDYATFGATIPFRQLVMNGLIDYTTEDVNLSSKNRAYFVLQAAELGSFPKFILTWKNVDVLKNSDFSYLYSAQFRLLEDKIRDVYQECASIRSRIGTNEITGHEVIDGGVYHTTYAGGAEVYVNYNLYEVTLPDGTQLPAEGYLIKEGK